MENGARDSGVDQIMVSVIKRLDDYYEVLTEVQAKREIAEATKLPILVCLPAEGKDNILEWKLTFLLTFIPTQ